MVYHHLPCEIHVLRYMVYVYIYIHNYIYIYICIYIYPVLNIHIFPYFERDPGRNLFFSHMVLRSEEYGGGATCGDPGSSRGSGSQE